jgi:hypothetical protein
MSSLARNRAAGAEEEIEYEPASEKDEEAFAAFVGQPEEEPEESEIRLMDPVCDFNPRPHYRPGEYDVYCTRARSYYYRRFRRWNAELKFQLVPDGGVVFGFFNLGRNPKKPHAGRDSKYRQAWTIANHAAPRKRQVMTPKVFEGKYFRVRITDVVKHNDGKHNHPESERYSRVEEILCTIP